SPDGERLATVGQDGVHLWDGTGARVWTIGRHRGFDGVAFSPNEDLLAVGGGLGLIHLVEVSTGEVVRSLHGHTNIVSSVAFSPPGRGLASGGLARTVRLWDVDSGQELLSLPGVAESVEGVAFSADGRQIAAADVDVTVWEAGPAKE